MTDPLPGRALRLSDTLTLTRVGYGALQLAGPMAYGPPRDRDEALAVLRAAADAGITHLDTSDYYGPYLVNELIREALHPYPEGLHLATKVGARRTPDRGWPAALSRPELVRAVHDNLDHLGLDAIDLVNLRMTGTLEPADIVEPFTVLAELREQGLIRNLGVSNVSRAQVEAAGRIAPVVAVQNHYNVAHRQDDALVDWCAERNIAFVPFWPLGGFRPLQVQALEQVAAELGAAPRQIALAWLLHRSPAVLLIPGTSTRAHLAQNIAAAAIELPEEALRLLNAIAEPPR
ncbi:Predicted oxidoreductase [Actinacidiphila yanglinensis]|uniref:Predicted oxidoreductase n=1 Tax=Actinacidiphila yanglinensis TaxID=310779 RepID=A0A1H6EER5_9ACTN|nr:oxidoreductase [Actinacidiphila yanglinensis]SEG95354.1 Predicted oxidoreductase [Actinacidiphila yanglinensis]